MYNIGIKNGKFVFYDLNDKLIEVNDPNITKENLKIVISDFIKCQSKPLAVKEVIYKSLSKLSGYTTKIFLIASTKNENSDPLYQELKDYVLSIEEYQKLVYCTRVLKVKDDRFYIFDINGTVVENCEFDIEDLKSKIDSYLLLNTNQLSESIILKDILTDFFDVTKIGHICHTNNNIVYLINYIITCNNYNKNIIKNSKICFKNGAIKIKCNKKYYEPDSNINPESLKQQILLYIDANPSEVNLKQIIFTSLEILSGFKSINKVPRYETISIDENNNKRKIYLEDPLYKLLCEFINNLPIYKENLQKIKENGNEWIETVRKNRAFQKEKDFVDKHTFEFHETQIPKYFYANLRRN